MSTRMYCGGHGLDLPCATCTRNLAKRLERTEHLAPAALTLPTPALLAEVDAGLTLRICRRETTARDVLIVQAPPARLKTASEAPVRGMEPLDGMLVLGDIEPSDALPTISFTAFEERVRRAA